MILKKFYGNCEIFEQVVTTMRFKYNTFWILDSYGSFDSLLIYYKFVEETREYSPWNLPICPWIENCLKEKLIPNLHDCKFTERVEKTKKNFIPILQSQPVTTIQYQNILEKNKGSRCKKWDWTKGNYARCSGSNY